MKVRNSTRRAAARRFEVAALERRVLLSVSVGVLADVETAPGNVWNYDDIATDGTVDSTETDTVVSATTYGGQPATEFDRQYDDSSSGGGTTTDKLYIAQVGQQLVEYAETDNQYGSDGIGTLTTSRTFSPYELLFATLSVGSPVASTFTQNYTITSGGTITQDTNTQTVTGELVSDATQSVTVPAGTFDCYEVTEHIDIVSSGGDNGTPNTRDFTAFLAPGVGFVETSLSVDGQAPTDTVELTSFTAGDRLAFDQPPTNVPEGDPIQPAIAVSVRDPSGNIDTDASGTVTLTPIGVNGANPITGNTATLVNGVATFGDVVLAKAGLYQLQATDTNDDAMVTSGKFGVGGDTLKFLLQPKNGDVNDPLSVKVEAITPQGKVDKTLDDSVQLGLNVVSGGTDATLSGTTTVALTNGVATFAASAKMSVNASGTYTLGATGLSDGSTDYTVIGATSDAFSIAGFHLVVSKQPANVNVSDPIPLAVKAVDAKGRLDTDENSAQVQLSFNTVDGGSGATLGGATTATFQGGIATFPATAAPNLNSVGTYTFTAMEVGTADPATQVDTKQFKALGYTLKDLNQFNPKPVAGTPDLIVDGVPTGAVQLLYGIFDQDGKVVAPTTDLSTFSMAEISGEPDGGSGTLIGGTAGGIAPVAASTYSIRDENGGDTFQSDAPVGAAYVLRYTFTEAGTYKITIAPAADAAATFAAFSETVKVLSPTLGHQQVLGESTAANEPINVEADLVRQREIEGPSLSNKYALQPSPSVGYRVTLQSSSSGGTFTGASPRTEYSTTVQQRSESGSFTVGTFSIAFTAAGTYVLQLQEMITPDGAAFDPNNAAPVTTTTANPATFNLRILPDKLVVTQQPPAIATANQPFSVSVAFEDQDGNVLTSQTSSDDDPLQAVLGAASTHGANLLNATASFEGGVATFNNVILMYPGAYKLKFTVSAGSLPTSADLTVKSFVFRVV